MQPVGQRGMGEPFKSTLSNASFVNKISSFRDISKGPDVIPDSASASSSDG